MLATRTPATWTPATRTPTMWPRKTPSEAGRAGDRSMRYASTALDSASTVAPASGFAAAPGLEATAAVSLDVEFELLVLLRGVQDH